MSRIPYSLWPPELKAKRNARRRENRKHMTPEAREKERTKLQIYRIHNREKINNSNNLRNKTTICGRWSKYKSKAKERKAKWRLSWKEFEQLVHSDCYYCGRKPNPLNCVDRVDKRAGFESDNCKPACEICTHMRKRLQGVDFITHATKIAEYQIELETAQ